MPSARTAWRPSNPFAAREGPGIVEVLRLTGFRSYSEFIEDTSALERMLLVEAIGAWHDKREASGGGGGAGGSPGF